MLRNPILQGFYPDPSICRVGQDFYLVTSSFSYFPGVPIFHSRDLAHWEQIGHVLDRMEQVHLTYEDISMGIFAPTIRYNNGIFYMITTNMTTHENFFCTATDPAGDWSNPIVIADAQGIDPSLFFDEDGRAYFTGTIGFVQEQYIMGSEINLSTGQLVGPRWNLGSGAMKHAVAPESPHLYKKDGWYYLMIAEGGTEFYHAVTISRSKTIEGPYENFQGNPILTHRHMGKNYPICNVGHADLVDLPDGSWYMVCLGSRLIGGYHKPLGRETFIAPVQWEDGWPVVSEGTGKIEWEYPNPNLPDTPVSYREETDAFLENRLNFEWNYLGTPYEQFATVEKNKLHIKMLPQSMVPKEFEGETFDFFAHMQKNGKTKKNMPFLGKRMKNASFFAETLMEVSPQGTESAGMVILQNNANQLRFECKATDTEMMQFSVVSVHYELLDGKMHYEEKTEGEIKVLPAPAYSLRILGKENKYSFSVVGSGEECFVAGEIDGSHLGSETAGGFVGTYIGLFATGNGSETENEAVFHYFTLKNS